MNSLSIYYKNRQRLLKKSEQKIFAKAKKVRIFALPFGEVH